MIATAREPQTCSDNEAVYRLALATLKDDGVEFLVGGSYGLESITGIVRQTKDLDVFVRPTDYQRAVAALERGGFTSELTFPHWLGKVYWGETFIDVIFSSGNGICEVDDQWFEHALDGVLFGESVRLCSAIETIWSKSFIMERERYDGADVAHIIRHSGAALDWKRLLQRFDGHWRVLFSHVNLFAYIYPAERDTIPDWLQFDLIRRMLTEIESDPGEPFLCRGTFLSRAQYQTDVSEWGYADARVSPGGTMSDADAAHWSQQSEG